MSNLECYRQQSLFTDPDPQASLYDGLPRDIGEICRWKWSSVMQLSNDNWRIVAYNVPCRKRPKGLSRAFR